MKLFIILSALSALLSNQSAKQTEQDESGFEIVVKARKPLDPKFMRAVIHQLGHRSDTGNGDYQMARWIDPVCPVVLGLSGGDAQKLVDDVKTIASGVGAPVGGVSCTRNIEIVITSDPRSALLDEKRRQPLFFKGIARSEVDAMINGNSPIRWGSATITYNANGTPMQANGTIFDPGGASRLHVATQTGLGRMIVIVDRDNVENFSNDALNDYISFVSLAQINQGFSDVRRESILNEPCQGDDDREGLCPFDKAYLKALYQMPADLHGSDQQAFMVRQINKFLRK